MRESARSDSAIYESANQYGIRRRFGERKWKLNSQKKMKRKGPERQERDLGNLEKLRQDEERKADRRGEVGKGKNGCQCLRKRRGGDEVLRTKKGKSDHTSSSRGRTEFAVGWE